MTTTADAPSLPFAAGAFQVVGHRGARGLAPENTSASLRAALDADADGVELDVLLTRDGVPVVWHDPVLLPEKLGPASSHLAGMQVNRLAARELADLDVGGVTLAQFPRQVAHGGGIESLSTVLRLVLDHPARPWVLLEVKSEPAKAGLAAGAAETTRACLKVLDRLVADGRDRADVHGRVVLESFDWAAVQEAGRGDPRLARAALAVGPGQGVHSPTVVDVSPWLGGVDLGAHEDALGAVASLGVQAVTPLSAWMLGMAEPAAWVARAHDLGLAVLPWTVNDPAQALALRDVGCAGVVTDVPDEIRAALGAR